MTSCISMALAQVPVCAQTAASFYQRGVIFEKKSEFKSAEEAYRAALAIDPAHVPSLNDLGVLLESRGGMAAAADLFVKAAAAAPDNPVFAWNRQRSLQSEQGMHLLAEGKAILGLEFRDQRGILLADAGSGENPVPGADDTFARFRIKAASLHSGDQFEVKKAEQMVLRCMELSAVDDAECIVAPTTGGVNVTLQLTLAPRLGKVGFIGNCLVPDSVLEAATGLKPGDRISGATVTRAELAVEAVYLRIIVICRLLTAELISRGPIFCADPSLLAGRWRRALTQFHKAALGTLDVDALSAEDRAFLDSKFILDCEGIKIEQSGSGTCDLLLQIDDPWSLGRETIVEVRTVDQNIARDPDPHQALFTAREWLEEQGFHGATLRECHTTGSHASELKTTVTMTPGVCHSIRRVDFAITKAWVAEAANKYFPLQKASIFKDRSFSPTVVQQIEDLLKQLRTKGGIESVPQAHAVAPGWVDVVIALDPPQDQRPHAAGLPMIGRINIAGNTKTPDRIIRRALPPRMQPGQRFDPRDVDKITPCLIKIGIGSFSVDYRNTDHTTPFHDVSIVIEE